MTPEEWQRVRPILESALELECAQRPSYLDRECSEPSLRHEVESLIAAHELAGTAPLNGEAAPGFVAENEARFRLPLGKRIGVYEIAGQIAVGGMGAVYCAVRADGQYKQQVALKVVRSELGAESTATRFRNERQILASLDHSNIAKILDGGTTADGLPYFVMEFIDGLPITEYCDVHELSIDARLNLFRTVCSAVHYAHQHLVIHRDLKPSNILVTAEGIPKLLDFGIAKILDPGLVQETMTMTAAGLWMMTPEYASPEQFRGAAVTTATDVYSLGLVLYELLTGSAAYNFSSRMPHEIARVVLETDPKKPSTAIRGKDGIAEQGEKAPPATEAIGNVRGDSPEKLRKRISGDLDNIVMKAIRKEPGERYSSADQLSEDIRRHLEHLPVLARKSTLAYRCRKYVLRHKVGVAAAALVFLSLLTGVVLTLREARIARANQRRAEERFKDVRELASSLIFEVHDAIRDLPGSTPARKQIVAKALKYLDNLAREPQNDPALLRELAAGYRRIGEVDASNLGDPAGAVASYKKAIAIRQDLLGSRYANLDDLVEFTQASRLAAGASLSVDGQTATTLQTYQRMAKMLEQAQVLHPGNVAVLRELMWNYWSQAGLLAGGLGLSNLGDVVSALPARRRQLELAEQVCALEPTNPDFRRDLAASLGLMGDLLYDSGEENEASQDYVKAQKILETLVVESPKPKVLQGLYDSHYRMVTIKIEQGDLQGATLDAGRALEIANQLSAADPKNTVPRLLLVAAYSYVAITKSWSKDRQAAESAIMSAMNIDTELVKNNPSGNEFRKMQAVHFEEAGEVFQKLEEPSKALHAYEECSATFSRMQSKDPADVGLRFYLAACYNGMGSALGELHRPDEAEVLHKKALNLTQSDTTKNSPNEEALYRIADSYSGLGKEEEALAAEPGQTQLKQTEHWENSRAYYERSLRVWGQVKRPKRLSPEGIGCIEPAVVSRRLAAVNKTLRRLQATTAETARP